MSIWTERRVRYEKGEEKPLGPRAEKTRDAVLAAAAEVLVERGYAGTTMSDVADRAGVAVGSVYQYFRDRSDLVSALVRRAVADLRSRADIGWRASEGDAGIERVIANYVHGYRRWAGMARVWEEVTFLDDDLLQLRRAFGRAFTAPVEREIRRLVDDDQIDAAIDPAITATALTAMVDRWCYVTYVLDPPTVPPDPESAARVLARLWMGSLGLYRGEGRRSPGPLASRPRR